MTRNYFFKTEIAFLHDVIPNFLFSRLHLWRRGEFRWCNYARRLDLDLVNNASRCDWLQTENDSGLCRISFYLVHNFHSKQVSVACRSPALQQNPKSLLCFQHPQESVKLVYVIHIIFFSSLHIIRSVSVDRSAGAQTSSLRSRIVKSKLSVRSAVGLVPPFHSELVTRGFQVWNARVLSRKYDMAQLPVTKESSCVQDFLRKLTSQKRTPPNQPTSWMQHFDTKDSSSFGLLSEPDSETYEGALVVLQYTTVDEVSSSKCKRALRKKYFLFL